MVSAFDEPTKLYSSNLDYGRLQQRHQGHSFSLVINRVGISDLSFDSLVLLILLQGNKQFDSPFLCSTILFLP